MNEPKTIEGLMEMVGTFAMNGKCLPPNFGVKYSREIETYARELMKQETLEGVQAGMELAKSLAQVPNVLPKAGDSGVNSEVKLGDHFTHVRSGSRLICTAINRRMTNVGTRQVLTLGVEQDD